MVSCQNYLAESLAAPLHETPGIQSHYADFEDNATVRADLTWHWVIVAHEQGLLSLCSCTVQKHGKRFHQRYPASTTLNCTETECIRTWTVKRKRLHNKQLPSSLSVTPKGYASRAPRSLSTREHARVPSLDLRMLGISHHHHHHHHLKTADKKSETNQTNNKDSLYYTNNCPLFSTTQGFYFQVHNTTLPRKRPRKMVWKCCPKKFQFTSFATSCLYTRGSHIKNYLYIKWRWLPYIKSVKRVWYTSERVKHSINFQAGYEKWLLLLMVQHFEKILHLQIQL